MSDGGKIRSHRERLGWTQAEAASHLGMSRRAYIDAEQDGRSRPLRRYELAGILALFERAKKDARPRPQNTQGQTSAPNTNQLKTPNES